MKILTEYTFLFTKPRNYKQNYGEKKMKYKNMKSMICKIQC